MAHFGLKNLSYLCSYYSFMEQFTQILKCNRNTFKALTDFTCSLTSSLILSYPLLSLVPRSLRELTRQQSHVPVHNTGEFPSCWRDTAFFRYLLVWSGRRHFQHNQRCLPEWFLTTPRWRIYTLLLVLHPWLDRSVGKIRVVVSEATAKF